VSTIRVLPGGSRGLPPLGRAPLGRGLTGGRERDGLVWRVDWVIAGSALVLSLLGALLVWSATRPRLLETGADPDSYLHRHLLNLAIGLLLGTLVAVVDYRLLRAYAPLIYLLSVAGLVAVLLIGSTINGAHSWIVLGGGFQVQPSEFAKVALVAGMAVLLAERRSQEHTSTSADVLLVLAVAAVPLGLVMLQPDLGTAMVFVFTVLGVLALGGAPARWLLGLVLVGVLAIVGAVRLGVLQDYQLERFKVFTSADQQDELGAAYNSRQSLIAIANGGLTGTGLFKGEQTNGKFVPEQQTDFVFSVAGEELGLLGAGGIVLLFGLLLWRALRLAGRSPDLFGRLVAGGVAVWFAFQTFVNIGMTLGIMPITGLPLPFVSYGGSAMFANWMAVGLLLNVHARSREADRG
jgi:rod shape determining protein RodA